MLAARAEARYVKPTNSMRSVCNGALRLHAARGTHVANIHKTLRDQRAFFCFHRLMTAGASNNRRFFVLHILSPVACP